MRRRAIRPRRGITLVEVMAAMTALAIVLALAAAMIEMLLRLDASGRKHLAAEVALSRVARTVREDVRAASAVGRCPVGESSPKLMLTLADSGHVVEYAVRAGGLARVEWDGDIILEQETLALPPIVSARFERRSEGAGEVVSLVLDRRSLRPDGLGVIKSLRVEATPGASHRFHNREDRP